jgi:hypothetical protein
MVMKHKTKKRNQKRAKNGQQMGSRVVRKCDIKEPGLKAVYDHKQSVTENLAKADIKEIYHDRMPNPEDIVIKHHCKVNEDEAPILKKLVAKYGEDNYSKMAMDHKINKWQWTAKWLEKKVPAFLAGKLRSEEAELMSGRGLDLKRVFPDGAPHSVFRI